MNMPFRGAKLALFVGDDLAVILRDDIPHIPFPNCWDFPGGGREGDETRAGGLHSQRPGEQPAIGRAGGQAGLPSGPYPAPTRRR